MKQAYMTDLPYPIPDQILIQQEDHALAGLVQQLKSEISHLKRHINNVDRLMVEKEMHTQSLEMDLAYARQYAHSLQQKKPSLRLAKWFKKFWQ